MCNGGVSYCKLLQFFNNGCILFGIPMFNCVIFDCTVLQYVLTGCFIVLFSNL